MKRKSLFLIVTLCMTFALTSCGGKNTSNETPQSGDTAAEEVTASETSAEEKPQKDGFDENTNMKIEFGNYIFSIPSYYAADITESDHYRAFAETGGEMACIQLFAFVDEEDPVSYEALKEEVEDGTAPEAFKSMFDSCNGVTVIPFETDTIKGFLYSTDYTKGDDTGYAQCMIFPSVDDNKWFFILLTQTEGTDYSYTDDFKKILSSTKMKESYQEISYGGVVFMLPGDFELVGENDKGYSVYGWEKGKRTEAALLGSIESNMTDDEFKQKKEQMFDSLKDPWDLSSEIREKEIADLQAFDVDYVDVTGPIDRKMHALLINNPSQGQVIVVQLIYTDNIGERGERDYQELCETAYIGEADTDSTISDSDIPSGVDPDLKAFLDSYEAFVDEYVDFMKSYMEDPTNAISLLSEYTEILERLEDYEEKIDAYDTDEMSEADLNYYLDVTSRCTKKMMSIY